MELKNKNFLFILSGILILFVGIGIGLSLGKIKYSLPSGRQAQNKNFGQISEVKKTTEDWVGEFKVSRVIDGDTIEIEGGERVRYIGMDAPETVEPLKPVQCFGQEATLKNKELVEGKTVRLEKDTTDRDKYDRLLRYVYIGETLVNQELVQLGFARAWAYPPDVKYQDQINEAERAAKKLKSGLWTAYK